MNTRLDKARILLLLATTSYRTEAFMAAMDDAGVAVDLVVGSDRRNALEHLTGGGTIALDFARPQRAAAEVAELHQQEPFDAVVSTDDRTSALSAVICEELGLPTHGSEAVAVASDKARARQRLSEAGLAGPRWMVLEPDRDPAELATQIEDTTGFPVVIKPVDLSASRGVIRADDRSAAVAAIERARDIARGAKASGVLLAESFVAGPEVAVEALVTRGRVEVIAIFDKPDPLDGPYFEETIYVAPARLDAVQRQAVEDATSNAVAAIGLHHGPVHAELRLSESGPVVLEVAPRSIGGLCGRTIEMATATPLEVLITRHALGLAGDLPTSMARTLAETAVGVMMLPIPARGVLRGLSGVDEALAVPGVTDVRLTHPLEQELVPLPEGDRYLGFMFARAATPDAVEQTLRAGHAALTVEIDGDI